MSTIRPCSESVRRIIRASSHSSAIAQFRVAKHSGAINLDRATLPLSNLKSLPYRFKRNYHRPRESVHYLNRPTGACGFSHVAMDFNSSTRGASTTATCSGLDFTRLSKGFPDPNLWYVLTAITMTAVGRQHLLGELWQHLAVVSNQDICQQGSGEEESVTEAKPELPPQMEQEVVRLEKVAMRLREGLMKMSVLFGYPRAINALSSLYKSQQQLSSSSSPKALLHSTLFSRLHGLSAPRTYLRPATTDPDEIPVNNYTRGLALFTKIYSPKHAPKVLHNMSVCSGGDLSNFAVSRIYGDLLSDVSILNERETGLACFVTCLALALSAGPGELDLAGQIKGHMYGAKNLGARGAEVREAVHITIGVWEAVSGGSFQDAPDSVKLVVEKAKEW